MTHHHHDDDHSHNHDHEHPHDIQSSLSFDEKMIKLLENWINHNAEHAKTYRDWAKKAKENNLTDAGSLLEEAAEMTLLISKKFEKAAEQITRIKAC